MISNSLRCLIQCRGETLAVVAKNTGLSCQQLSAIQNNKPSKIAYETIEVLLRYFDCDFNTFFCLDHG